MILEIKALWKKILKDSFKEGNSIQSVIHFAGLKSVSEFAKYSLEYWDVNVCATINLLEIMKDNECYSIVLAVVPLSKAYQTKYLLVKIRNVQLIILMEKE